MRRKPRIEISPELLALAAKWLARRKPKPRKVQRAKYAARMLDRASVNLRRAGGLLAGKHGKTPPNPPAESAPAPK